jgi:hypothetical protein
MHHEAPDIGALGYLLPLTGNQLLCLLFAAQSLFDY